MKVVCKEGCNQVEVNMPLSGIATDTVFSGRPDGFSNGVFYKCNGGCVRLAYASDHVCDGHVIKKGIVKNYKELNAYLCIEE